MTTTPSGISWCAQFPTAKTTAALLPAFGEKVDRFIAALRNAGATVTISATYRPKERAYLMHYCCAIADGLSKPEAVPAMPGVDIDWTHGGNVEAAMTAAILMKHEYKIAYPAALESRHTQRRAIDMTIDFTAPINVLNASDVSKPVHAKEDLYSIGAGYGVIKLVSDAPHWSDDGH